MESDGSDMDKRDRIRDLYVSRIVSFLLTPVDASKGFENVDTGWGSGDARVNVGREDEMGIESNSMYATLLSRGSIDDNFIVWYGRD